MRFLIKCVGIFIVAFNLQSALAADNTIKNSVSVKSTPLKKEILDVRVTKAIVYVPLGTSKTTTGFFTIDNRSASDITITEVTSNFARQIKLMPRPNLTVPAHESVTLTPKGSFLQINDLKAKLNTGDELQLSVSLSNGQRLQIIAVAKSAYDQTHGH